MRKIFPPFCLFFLCVWSHWKNRRLPVGTPRLGIRLTLPIAKARGFTTHLIILYGFEKSASDANTDIGPWRPCNLYGLKTQETLHEMISTAEIWFRSTSSMYEASLPFSISLSLQLSLQHATASSRYIHWILCHRRGFSYSRIIFSSGTFF